MFNNICRVPVGPFGSLFVVGNKELLSDSLSSLRFSVSGARQIDSSSSDWLRSTVSQLTSEHILVSGLALGSDSIAHQTALQHHIPQIAVLPSGFNNIYPVRNIELAKQIVADGGCLVSQFHPNTRPSRASFVSRNELIAYLGHMLIVPQFEARSGTRHTVDFAQKMNKYIIVQNQHNYSGNSFIISSPSYKTITK